MPYRPTLYVAALLGALAALLALRATATSAQPATVLVVDGAAGSDANPGTDAAPLARVQTAVDRIAPGGQVLVRNGTYSEGPITIAGKNGAPGVYTTLAAYPGHRPRLSRGFWQVVRVWRSSYVEVRGFEIVGSANADRDPTAGVEVDESHHVTIADNVIRDVGGAGINVIRSDHLRIERNDIANTSRWNGFQTSAISLWESTNRGGPPNADGFTNYIVANSVRDARNNIGFITDGNCIILDHGQPNGYSGPTLIANNICSNNGGRGIHMMRHDNVLVVNNTLAKNVQRLDQPGGELSVVRSRNVTFRNNLVNASRPDTAVVVSDSVNVTSDNNTFLGLTRSPLSGSGDRAVYDQALSYGFGAAPTNSAVDAGNPAGAPTTDINGRPRRGAPDIGAIEY